MTKVRNRYRKLSQSLDEFPIVIERNPIVSLDSKIFTIGSCFALEIRNYLIDNGYNVLNRDLDYELIWYNTYTILGEFQRASGEFLQSEDDVWQVKDGSWHDPYRRHTTAETKEKLWGKIKGMDSKIIGYLGSADIVVITLGLTEVFFQPCNGNAICATPGYPKGKGGGQECEFRFTEYEDNFNNIDACMKILQKINPNCQLIITTSPVPLAVTFGECDQLIANTESKAILRAVCGAITRKYDNAHYYHSYELVVNSQKEKVFKPDGRHIQPEYVADIMKEFRKYFVI